MIQLLSILDIKTDRNQYISKFSNTGFIESQTYYAYRLKDDLINAMTTWKPKIITAKYTGATEFLFDRIDAQSPLSNQILLVTVESWGRTLDHNVEIDLLQGFLQNTNQFEYFNQGELPFIGATVNAELRELCRLDTMNFNLRAAEPLKFKNCLGNRLQELGYQTYGIHGANGLMYDRSSWYPKAGLAHTTFFENLKNPTRCYSFPGACDSDLIPVVYDAFRDKKKKTFLHWMSITSHYPYDLRDLKSDHFDCTRFDIPNHTEGCRNLKLQKQFLNDLAIMIHNPALKGVEVIVVGDHMPPLIMDHGSTVFKPNIVPWLHFKIKE